ncbi:MAG: hypothetical protein JO197_15460 [Acidobacteria bacterium]|nr:hypothetical protein [Acidobacteriota bacterium]MBV9475080.1 hypothetical protein [Acidobacteriota bacterium]
MKNYALPDLGVLADALGCVLVSGEGNANAPLPPRQRDQRERFVHRCRQVEADGQPRHLGGDRRLRPPNERFPVERTIVAYNALPDFVGGTLQRILNPLPSCNEDDIPRCRVLDGDLREKRCLSHTASTGETKNRLGRRPAHDAANRDRHVVPDFSQSPVQLRQRGFSETREASERDRRQIQAAQQCLEREATLPAAPELKQ